MEHTNKCLSWEKIRKKYPNSKVRFSDEEGSYGFDTQEEFKKWHVEKYPPLEEKKEETE